MNTIDMRKRKISEETAFNMPEGNPLGGGDHAAKQIPRDGDTEDTEVTSKRGNMLWILIIFLRELRASVYSVSKELSFCHSCNRPVALGLLACSAAQLRYYGADSFQESRSHEHAVRSAQGRSVDAPLAYFFHRAVDSSPR